MINSVNKEIESHEQDDDKKVVSKAGIMENFFCNLVIMGSWQ